MPEAEELLVDAARHATAALAAAWRRHRPPAPGNELELREAKPRVELLVHAVLGRPWPIRVAQGSAPVSILRRLLRRDTPPVGTAALPGNDGTAIYLPASLARPAVGTAAPDDYCLLALLQGIRCQRGSAALLRQAGTPLLADLYGLAEGAAADRQLRSLLPGWKAALDGLYARTARELGRLPPAGGLAAEVKALYAAFLRGAAGSLPLAAAPEAALAWAADHAESLRRRHPRETYRPWLADPVLGRLFPPEAGPGPSAAGPPPPEACPRREGRQAPLARRPRVRPGAEDEDDAVPGIWMIQTSEPLPHAEDPLGLSRPEDREGDGDAQGAADSLAEMEEARLIHGPGRVREVLYSDDPPPRREEDGKAVSPVPADFRYPEWDYRAGLYLDDAVRLRTGPCPEGAAEWAAGVLERHAGMLREMRRRLGAIRPARELLKRQSEGEEIDCDAVVAERSARRAGVALTGAFYQTRRPAPRRLGLLILLDASGSTDAWIGGDTRVIDVEKEAALVAAAALEAIRAEFAMLAFSGEGAAGVQMQEVKGFDDPWEASACRRLAGLQPDRYTRLGAALRHAGRLLAHRRVDHRLLLLLSDGRPNDCDCYASRYGIEDSRQALTEAQRQHIAPYCLTVDRAGSAYLPRLFGVGRYTIVGHPRQLPLAFMAWLRQAARRSRR